MATTSQVPAFVRLANMLTSALMRTGFKLAGPNNVPMYMLTVRGRKSGQPRTTPIVAIEQEGRRYLVAPFGEVDWVRNLRAAGEATLTRGRRTESIRARELPRDEASLVLQRSVESDRIPSFLAKYLEITAQSPREEFEKSAVRHPVFLLQSPA